MTNAQTVFMRVSVSVTLTIILGLLGIAVPLVVNWMIWFRLLPMVLRQLMDQLRHRRERLKSN